MLRQSLLGNRIPIRIIGCRCRMSTVSEGKLYDTHEPTEALGKIVLTVGAAYKSLTDPYRGDMIAALSETTGAAAFRYMRQVMENDEEGRTILREKPRINSKTVDFDELSRMPPNTLGYTYWKFMKDNKISSDAREPVHYVDDVEDAYIATRYREVHDLFHTMLDQPTNMLGEVTVKWVEALHTHLPMCAAGGLFGAMRLKPKQRSAYVSRNLPWALKQGFEARNLMLVYYEKRWNQDVKELRKELNIIPLSTQYEEHQQTDQ